jgi:hypothetical protein
MKDCSVSPENTTERVKVVRWHDIHGTPSYFLVVDEDGCELRRFPAEWTAIAYAEQEELRLRAEEEERERAAQLTPTEAEQ